MDDTGNAAANESINGIFSLFFDEAPISAEIIDTSRGESDFRNAVIVTSKEGAKYVLKIASNDFTFPEKIAMWQKTIEEYRDLGYYCPRIIADKQGLFPKVKYQDRDCYAFAEEYSKYKTLGSPDRSAQDVPGEEYDKYLKDIWRMTARIASKRLDYTDFPSAYCLFETFCPSDKIDEVLACALRWKELAESLPKEFAEQVQRIWRLWNENREMLKKIYPALPTSVFQADLNRSNLLIDEEGNFKGVLDFNICGKDVFLNYLMRDNDSDMIPKALKISSEYYIFSEEEKEAAPLLYRCLEPLCYGSIHDLKNAGNDAEAIKQSLDQSEKCLTEHIDFKSFMQ
jgi:hypothetical protein